MVKRSLDVVMIPSHLETSGLLHSDGKPHDGVTVVHLEGKQDVSVECHLSRTLIYPIVIMQHPHLQRSRGCGGGGREDEEG